MALGLKGLMQKGKVNRLMTKIKVAIDLPSFTIAKISLLLAL